MSYDDNSARLRAGQSQITMSVEARAYLQAGLTQPGAKLPLFDPLGQRIPMSTVRSCIRKGWCEPWFASPMKPDWMVCRLTEAGRRALSR